MGLKKHEGKLII